jgi:hypothetical protein
MLLLGWLAVHYLLNYSTDLDKYLEFFCLFCGIGENFLSWIGFEPRTYLEPSLFTMLSSLAYIAL